MAVLILSDRPERIASAVKAAGATPCYKDGTSWSADIEMIVNEGQDVAEAIRQRVRVVDL